MKRGEASEKPVYRARVPCPPANKIQRAARIIGLERLRGSAARESDSTRVSSLCDRYGRPARTQLQSYPVCLWDRHPCPLALQDHESLCDRVAAPPATAPRG